MGRYALWRILQFPLILVIIYLITFVMVWVVPGSPIAQGQHNTSEQSRAQRLHEMHADTWEAFLGYYPAQLFRGNFGYSMQYEEWTVNDILKSALPVSISLGLFAMVIATFGGVMLGTLAAVRRGGIVDLLSLSLALLGISLPSFVAAAVLFEIFAAWLHWVPVASWGSLRDMLLPGIALSLLPMAYIARLTRVSMIETLSADYVRTAKAKGLRRTTIIWKHALRNAALPVLSFLGPATANALTGSFVVEKVFTVPGLGQHFVNSVLNRDRTLILATVMVYSFFVLLFNLLVDIAYAWVDPRIELAGAA